MNTYRSSFLTFLNKHLFISYNIFQFIPFEVFAKKLRTFYVLIVVTIDVAKEFFIDIIKSRKF